MSQDTIEKETFHVINCSCGMWEQFPSDMPRHHSQVFEHIENHATENTAKYKCPDCGKEIWSTNHKNL